MFDQWLNFRSKCIKFKFLVIHCYIPQQLLLFVLRFDDVRLSAWVICGCVAAQSLVLTSDHKSITARLIIVLERPFYIYTHNVLKHIKKRHHFQDYLKTTSRESPYVKTTHLCLREKVCDKNYYDCLILTQIWWKMLKVCIWYVQSPVVQWVKWNCARFRYKKAVENMPFTIPLVCLCNATTIGRRPPKSHHYGESHYFF